jgi:hypothetical protein
MSGGNVVSLASDNVQSISVDNGTDTQYLQPDTDSSLWFNVQKPAGDYTYTVITNSGATYTATLHWGGAVEVNATATHTPHATATNGNVYAEYSFEGINLSGDHPFDAMYEIKQPTGEAVSVVQLKPNGDSNENLWFNVAKPDGQYTYLIKRGNVWSHAVITVIGVQSVNVSNSLGDRWKSLQVGATDTLIATVFPENATFKDVQWRSSNYSIVTVDAHGVIKGLINGTVNITAKSLNGGIESSQAVYVDDTNPVITLTGEAAVNVPYGTSYTDLGAKVTDPDELALPTVVTTITNAAGDVITAIDTTVVGTYTVHYNVSDRAGNAAVEVKRTVVVQAPEISNVHISSNGSDPAKAFNNDIVTLTFHTAEQVSKLDDFKINGRDPGTFKSVESGSDWTNTATYQIGKDDLAGLVTFQISVKNAAGAYSTAKETTDKSSVEVMTTWKDTPVEISNVSISTSLPSIFGGYCEGSSCGGADQTAQFGDTVFLTFTTNEQVMKLSNFKINGSNPDFHLSGGPGFLPQDGKWFYIAVYTIQASDPTGPVTFQINVKNVSGVYSKTIEDTSDGSSVRILPPPVENPETQISGPSLNVYSENLNKPWTYLGHTYAPNTTFQVNVNFNGVTSSDFESAEVSLYDKQGTLLATDTAKPAFLAGGYAGLTDVFGMGDPASAEDPSWNIGGYTSSSMPAKVEFRLLDKKRVMHIVQANMAPIPADLTQYNAVLNAVHEADYTPMSWSIYQVVVLANVMTPANTQDEVSGAITAITAAQASLMPYPTVTSTVYTVSPVVSGSGTISNVPNGIGKLAFESGFTPGSGTEVLDFKGLSDHVVAGNTLVVSSLDGTKTTYTVIVDLPVVYPTVTSSVYTVTNIADGVGTITNVPSGTRPRDFAPSNFGFGPQTGTILWTGLSDPVVTGDTVVAISSTNSMRTTYTITVNDPISPPPASTPTPASVVPGLADMTAYNAALNAVHQENYYTPESWAAYQLAVQANVMTAANTQEQVGIATAAITTAQSSLVPAPGATDPGATTTDPGATTTDPGATDQGATTTDPGTPAGK